MRSEHWKVHRSTVDVPQAEIYFLFDPVTRLPRTSAAAASAGSMNWEYTSSVVEVLA